MSPQTPGHGSPTAALVVDVDGVVSPIDGPTAWGDDIVAGQVFGPVLVSPALCSALDELAARPDVVPIWLTSWSANMRAHMTPFPGQTWDELFRLPADPELGWWKWAALLRWLDAHPRIARIAWCDDQLTDTDLLELTSPEPPGLGAPSSRTQLYGLAVVRTELARRNVDALLIAPRTARGLTPAHVQRLSEMLTP